MIICVDIDATLNDLIDKTLEMYNMTYGKNIQIDDITTYHFCDCLTQEDAQGLEALFKEKKLWDSLRPLPGSQSALKQLIKKGHQIYLATATDPINFSWKIDWLKRYFSFIPSDNVIRIMDKSLLKCDILIDDCLDNLTSVFCERITLNYPWNQSRSKEIAYDIKRAFSWGDIIDIVNTIEREMKEWER